MRARTRESGTFRPRAERPRWLSRFVGVAAITALFSVGGFAPRSTAAGNTAFDVFQGATEAAPVRAGVGIPLEVFSKVGGSEAQVLQDPVGRGAGMLVDTRVTQLASLLIFGTVPAPPVALPSPTVAETIWTEGNPSPQTADASVVPAGEETGQASGGSAPARARAGRATAEAGEGPRGAGHAAYTDLALSPAGIEDAVQIRDTASESVAAVTAEAVETSSTSVSSGVALLGGTVTIETIRATAHAVSTGRPGEALAEGSFEMGRVTALGKEAEITPDGIRIVDTSIPLSLRDALNQQLQDTLAGAGLTIRMVPATRVVKEDGGFASIQSAGIYVRMAAVAAQPVNPVIGDLSLNLTLGFASADASASEASAFDDSSIIDGGDVAGAGAHTTESLDPSDGGAAPLSVGDGGPLRPRGDGAPTGRVSQGGSLSGGLDADDSSREAAAGAIDTETGTSSAASASPTGVSAGGFAPSRLAARRAVPQSDWWAPAFVLLLAGFAAVVGLQALPRLVRTGGPHR